MKGRVVQVFASALLLANFCMYFLSTVLAGWALNKALKSTFRIPVVEITGLAGLPITFTPLAVSVGNQVTAFVVIFALIAGCVGAGTCLSGFHDLMRWTASSLSSTASAATIAWALTVLAAGCACKEIAIGGRNTHLRVLEAFLIILSVTQLLYVSLVHTGFLLVYKEFEQRRPLRNSGPSSVPEATSA